MKTRQCIITDLRLLRNDKKGCEITLDFSYIKIVKLFGKYTTSIDLDKKCVVLLGANGVGKSTILNIIDALHKNDFVALSRFEFECIETNINYFDSTIDRSRDAKWSIRYEDIFPHANVFMHSLEDYYNGYFKYSSQRNTMPNISAIQELIKWAINNLKAYCRLIAQGSERFISDDSVIQERIQDLRLTDCDLDFLCNYIQSYLREVNGITYYTSSAFEGSCFEEKYKYGRRGTKRKSFIDLYATFDEFPLYHLDLVRDFSFSSDKFGREYYHSSLLNWINSSRQVDYQTNSLAKLYIKKDKKQDLKDLGYYENDLLVPLGFSRYLLSPMAGGKEFISLVKKIYESCSDITTDIIYKNGKVVPLERFIMDKFTESRVFNVNALIAARYYGIRKVHYPEDGKFWASVMNGEYAYNPKHIRLIDADDRKKYKSKVNIENGKIGVADFLKCFYSDKECRQIVIDYLIPTVCSGWPITPKQALEYFDRPDVTGLSVEDETRRYWFYKFYKMKIHWIFESGFYERSSKIDRLEEVLNKYLYDKTIRILPSGIKVFLNRDERNVPIPLNRLASGEKKIVLLMAMSILCENMRIMLDEPELSLSIVWQEDLLQDLLKSQNFRTLLIATHSPYLVSKEEVQDFILFLPEEAM